MADSQITPPSSKHLLTSILASLSSTTASSTSTGQPHISPLANLTGPSDTQAKSVLLTLHFLFPHELLPALDLIDRRLITHLSTPAPPPSANQTSPDPHPRLEVYYVQSASSSTDPSNSRKGRFRNALSRPGLFYEVRLDGWNCSCPAFAFSALKLMMRNDGCEIVEAGSDVSGVEWAVGGVATREDAVVPVCKHILAVVLGIAAPGLFGNGVVEREVSSEEIAGWAAGWGEH